MDPWHPPLNTAIRACKSIMIHMGEIISFPTHIKMSTRDELPLEAMGVMWY